MVKQAEDKEVKGEKTAPELEAGASPRVKWDDSKMVTSYTNAFNVFSSREELTLLFGTNQTLYTGQEEVSVELKNRLILSPYRAKAFAMMLNNVLDNYEKRYGKLTL